MQKALARFLRHHRAEGHAKKTILYYESSITLFIKFCQERGYSSDLADLDADTVREWMTDQRDRGLAEHTVAARVRALKIWTRWLVAEDRIERDPLRNLKTPKLPDKAKSTLSPAEVDRLLSLCNRKTENGRRDLAIMLLLFSTGLRAAEIVSLQANDIDWDKGLITIKRGKGGKFRVVPLGSKVERALDRYLDGRDTGALFLTRDGQPITYVTLRQMLRRYSEKTNIHANPHKWRHSSAIQYLRSGGRIENLRAMLGHSSLQITLHYARIAGVDLAEAHETADPTKALKTRG